MTQDRITVKDRKIQYMRVLEDEVKRLRKKNRDLVRQIITLEKEKKSLHMEIARLK